MTYPTLNSISLRDFRSIRGTVTVPLDAPVVLIHGPNGAGKTSVLSGIELALTGEVAAMRRVEPNYLSHLVHHGAHDGHVNLNVRGIGQRANEVGDLTIRGGATVGNSLLTGNLSRFFAERCYLAQATLVRLLEIYNDSSNQKESALTRFVRDLLGLDQLDAITDGLHAAFDRRNTRNLVPEFAATERAIAAALKQKTELETHINVTSSAGEDLQNEIHRTLLGAGIFTTGMGPDSLEFSDMGDAAAEDERLTQLAGWRRELASLNDQARRAAPTLERLDLMKLEAAAEQSRAARDAWMDHTGGPLESTIDGLRKQFPDLPSAAATDPQTAFAAALDRTQADLLRVTAAISEDNSAIEADTELRQDVERARARIALLVEQLADQAVDSSGVARALSALLPYIHNDQCPVCGRAYTEVADTPLAAHLASQISRLVGHADRVAALAGARREAEVDLQQAQQALAMNAERLFSRETRVGLQVRAAALTEASAGLKSFTSAVSEGSRLIRAEAEAKRDLSRMRYTSKLVGDLRIALNGLCQSAGFDAPKDSESIGGALTRIDSVVRREVEVLTARGVARHQVSLHQSDLVRLRVENERSRDSLSEVSARLRGLQEALASAELRMMSARTLAKATSSAHATIVRQVFNDSLNEIWRDLFVRLAPSEPFVPAFRIPEPGRHELVAQLTTSHRHGGQGGSPGAMLSAGNLNTAALTLFLSLHLAARSELPWLILDDPVQSMDEIHISQFAALLRTLSKQHGRRIIIAVHERPLFDYLALELSPAYQGDLLITVELRRSAEGESVAEPVFHHWQQDPVFETA